MAQGENKDAILELLATLFPGGALFVVAGYDEPQTDGRRPRAFFAGHLRNITGLETAELHALLLACTTESAVLTERAGMPEFTAAVMEMFEGISSGQAGEFKGTCQTQDLSGPQREA